MSDCLFAWGNPHVTATHDVNGQSQITWQWRIQGGRPPTDQNFLNFMQFLGKSGKLVCWRSPGVGVPSYGESCIRPCIGNLFKLVHLQTSPPWTCSNLLCSLRNPPFLILLFWTPGQASSPCLSGSLPVVNSFLIFTSLGKPLGSQDGSWTLLIHLLFQALVGHMSQCAVTDALRAHLYKVSAQHCDNSVMMLLILFSLKTMELLENGLQPHFGATSLFSMRTVSLASSEFSQYWYWRLV